jgi:PAS domain S-box-containing protein
MTNSLVTNRTSLRSRIARTSVLIAVVGAIATSSLFVVVRSDVDKLDRERVDQPAAQALLGVQHLTASVDQILATANGVVATSGVDPRRFIAVLGPDVDASSTLAGMALVTHTRGTPQVVARVGNTQLLTASVARRGEGASLASASGATLVAHRHDGHTFDLGFAADAAHGAAVVYLEVSLPATAPSSVGFSLITRGDHPQLLLGNSVDTRDQVAWHEPVSFGGMNVALLVGVNNGSPGLLGISLPLLVLLVGIALTLLALATGVVVARRGAAVRHLGDENRQLDEALERQHAIAAELRASEERFRAILRDSPDIIVLLDVDTGSSEVLNRPDFFGHAPETLNAPGGLHSIVHGDDREDADALWARMRELEPEHVSEMTMRIFDANDDVRHVRLRFSRLDTGERDDAHHPKRMLGAVSDITVQSNNEIREAELQEALRRSQRLEAVGQLAGGVAHDFNNLLAAILASAELLTDYLPDDGPPREYADEIQRSAVRGAALVRQLLTFAQRDHAEPRAVELNEIVSNMEPLLRRSLGQNVQLQITTTDCSTEIVGDPTHLEQVILNLAVNARHAMPAGGVLWIATAIDFDDEAPENDRVVLSVTDTGTGISDDVREHMFEPFVTTKAPGEGTGLGLSTVQSIVTGMEGHIDVHTKVDEGTTFEVSFARRFGELDPTTSARRDEDIEGGGRRVLLVDDDTAVRSALAHRLQRLGFAVTSASSGAEALQVVEQRTFDLVLTDSVMPGISGPELIAHLREARPELRIILMSGYTPDAALEGERARDESGGYQRLRKPFTTGQLAHALAIAFRPEPNQSAPIDQSPS